MITQALEDREKAAGHHLAKQRLGFDELSLIVWKTVIKGCIFKPRTRGLSLPCNDLIFIHSLVVLQVLVSKCPCHFALSHVFILYGAFGFDASEVPADCSSVRGQVIKERDNC